MSIEKCPNPQEDCPFYGKPPKSHTGETDIGCYSDQDHIIPRRLGQTALQKMWIQLPQNLRQICRWEHIQRNSEHDQGNCEDIPDFPSVDDMRKDLRDAILEDDMYISKAKCRILFSDHIQDVNEK